MSAQMTLPVPEPTEWCRPQGKHTCSRDPQAGPGTCWHWWEGCPQAEKRGCYQVWTARQFVRDSNDANARSFLKLHGLQP